MNLQEATILSLQNKLYEDENFVDDFYEVSVYKVCMDTYTGRRLYLTQTNTSVASWKDAKIYEWRFDPNGAMEFDTEEEAEKFARKYFKNFIGWYIYKTIGYR